MSKTVTIVMFEGDIDRIHWTVESACARLLKDAEIYAKDFIEDYENKEDYESDLQHEIESYLSWYEVYEVIVDSTGTDINQLETEGHVPRDIPNACVSWMSYINGNWKRCGFEIQSVTVKKRVVVEMGEMGEMGE